VFKIRRDPRPRPVLVPAENADPDAVIAEFNAEANAKAFAQQLDDPEMGNFKDEIGLADPGPR
jgi:hypothetical protein